jgi:multidrug transporter EmrE-like cation transporter
VPINADAKSTSKRPRRARRPSLAPREVVLGLDPLERRVSLIGAIFAFAISAVPGLDWLRNVKTLSKLTPSKTNTCTAGFHLVGSFCEKVTATRSSWAIQFFFVFVVALCLLYFALKRTRAGVACFAIFLGLGHVSDVGVLFFALGAWLILRAYRLQKYGDPTFAGSNRIAKEMSQAKREGRAPKLDVAKTTTDTVIKNVAKPPTPPPASKRYTPKKPPRRR